MFIQTAFENPVYYLLVIVIVMLSIVLHDAHARLRGGCEVL